MNNIKFSCIVLLTLLLPTILFAQLKQDGKINMAQALIKPTKIQSIFGSIGLDPNKFSMSHSYSLSFATSGGQSFNQGLYLNTMKYQFSEPLTVYMQVAFQHQPFGKFGNTRLNVGNNLFISSSGVEYNPSDKFQLRFEFNQYLTQYLNPWIRYRYLHYTD